ncbi:MAG: hypothetical protein LBH04_02455 [Tannerellaceae bacterium]|nr:hypothetical protein [Tannerellaceae bacterium]
MIYRFLIVSDEAENFMREIRIDSSATFLDFYNAVIKSVGYKTDQLCSFIICDDNWNKLNEVTLVEMNDSSYEEDSYVMEETRIEELVDEEEQHLLFVFDNLTERSFFIELREIIPGESLSEAVCTRSVGDPPAQSIDFEAIEQKISSNLSMDESFYGDEDYDIDELDSDGYDGLDDNSELPYDDERY